MARLSKNKRIKKQPSPEGVAQPNHTPNHLGVNHTSNTGDLNPTPTVREDPLNDLDFFYENSNLLLRLKSIKHKKHEQS